MSNVVANVVPKLGAEAASGNRSAPAGRFVAVVEAVLATGRSVSFRARGRSMLPTVADGARVAVAAIGPRVRVGEVVLCRVNGGALVLHRLVSLGPDGAARVCGDAPASQPDHVPRADLIGRALGVWERGRLRPIDDPLTRVRVCGRRLALRLWRLVRPGGPPSGPETPARRRRPP